MKEVGRKQARMMMSRYLSVSVTLGLSFTYEVGIITSHSKDEDNGASTKTPSFGVTSQCPEMLSHLGERCL